MIIRPTEEKDLDVIVKLNNLSSKWVGYKEKDFFKKYLDLPFFLVAISNSKITGFILAMDQLTEYDCKYFLWFKKRFTHFLYIDRIVVDPTATKKSIGTKLYDRIISNRGDNPVLCEVAIDPRNDVSIKFHEKYGFKKVGTCCVDGLKTNNMLKLG